MGCGHLGQALIRGLLSRHIVPPQAICVTAKSPETKSRLASAYGVRVCDANRELLLKTDILFITLPAKVFLQGGDDLGTAAQGNQIVSLMAGVPIATLQDYWKGAVISRAMPTLSIANGQGIIGYTQAAPCITAIYEKPGYSFLLEEEEIEKVTAFAACGYGFAAYILAAFQQAGEALGFDGETSRQMTARLFLQAAQETDFAKTAAAVSTPGGATEKGIPHLEHAHMAEMLAQAIHRAYEAVS